MKKLFTILLMLVLTSTTNAQWVGYQLPLDTLYNCGITSMTSNGINIYANIPGNGIHTSSNNGVNWNKISNTSFGVIAVNDYYIFGNGNTINKSSNNGLTWQWDTSVHGHIYSINVLGSSVFACGTSGIYKSTDYGVSWDTMRSPPGRWVYSLLISGTNWFVGCDAKKFYKSSDNGLTWTSVLNRSVFTLTMSGTKIYAGSDSGVYTSTNNGANWNTTSLPPKYIYSILTSGTNVFVSYGDTTGVLVSTNNGSTWRSKREGLPSSTSGIQLLINGNYIYLGDGYINPQRCVYRRSLSEIIDVKKISSEIPSKYSLSQNFPNPFNPSTKIEYSIPKSGLVTIKVYDILGKGIATLVNEIQSPGTYSVDFNGAELPSGIYFYRLQAGNYTETKQMILIK